MQISAYLDNVFDVAALMEDSETKTAALERVAELEDELAHVGSFPSFFVFVFVFPFEPFCVMIVFSRFVDRLWSGCPRWSRSRWPSWWSWRENWWK